MTGALSGCCGALPHLFIALSMALMVGDALFFLLFFRGLFAFSLYAALHIALSSLSWALYLVASRSEFDLKFHTLNALLLTFLGPFSFFICASAIAFFLLYRGINPPAELLLEELSPDVSRTRSELCSQSILTSGSPAASSEGSVPLNYYDIVELGTVKQKQQAIAKILRHFQPGFSPILKALVNDGMSSIRVLAATAINAIDQKYSAMAALQERVVGEEGDNPFELKKLALILHSYLELHILDPEREEKIEGEALAILERLNRELGDDLDIAFSLSMRYKARGEYKRAVDTLAKFVDREVELPPQVKLFYLEIAFECLQIDEWLKLLEKVTSHEGEKESYKKSDVEIEIEEMKNLWLPAEQLKRLKGEEKW